MNEPDGVDVVTTAETAARMPVPPLLVVDSVTAYLDTVGLGSGPISWQRIGDGQSNITFLIDRGGEQFVLRRGPRPPLPRSTHDMAREARIQSLLGARGIPVPTILSVCEDESVLGVPFYVMSLVEGLVITDNIPDSLSALPLRRQTSEATVDALVMLHSVEVSGDLAAFGRPEGYLQRQVERFSGLWAASATRELPLIDAIGERLLATVPRSQAAAVVHGDFRIGNLMFERGGRAEVAAILDWEMATIGDPLADLGYLTATYAEAGGASPTPMELTSVTRKAGYLDRAGLVSRYAERMDLDLEALPWYQALALWKASIFCEAIYVRWLAGERPGDTFGPALAEGIPTMLTQAAAFAGLDG